MIVNAKSVCQVAAKAVNAVSKYQKAERLKEDMVGVAARQTALICILTENPLVQELTAV